MYIAISSIGATSVVLWVRLAKPIPARGLLIADALGLAIATVTGADIALQMQTSPSVAIIMGVMTGVAGGVMRDVLCNEIPLILQREIYATASIAGAATFTALNAIKAPGMTASIAAMSLIFAVRVSAIRWHWALPRFHLLDQPH
jgi:uncharacterized membrane protein YeiH